MLSIGQALVRTFSCLASWTHFTLQDSESFLHRSGRTGRANKKGIAIVMYSQAESSQLGRMLRDTKTRDATAVGTPGPAEVMTAASKNVLLKLDKVREARVADRSNLKRCLGIMYRCCSWWRRPQTRPQWRANMDWCVSSIREAKWCD